MNHPRELLKSHVLSLFFRLHKSLTERPKTLRQRQVAHVRTKGMRQCKRYRILLPLNLGRDTASA